MIFIPRQPSALFDRATIETEYYVDFAAGTDDLAVGRGLSPGDPWKTLSYALLTAVPTRSATGVERFNVHGGSAQSLTVDGNGYYVDVSNRGAGVATTPVIISGYTTTPNDGTPWILDCQTNPAFGTAFYAGAADWYWLRDMICLGPRSNSGGNRALTLDRNSFLLNCYVTNDPANDGPNGGSLVNTENGSTWAFCTFHLQHTPSSGFRPIIQSGVASNFGCVFVNDMLDYTRSYTSEGCYLWNVLGVERGSRTAPQFTGEALFTYRAGGNVAFIGHPDSASVADWVGMERSGSMTRDDGGSFYIENVETGYRVRNDGQAGLAQLQVPVLGYNCQTLYDDPADGTDPDEANLFDFGGVELPSSLYPNARDLDFTPDNTLIENYSIGIGCDIAISPLVFPEQPILGFDPGIGFGRSASSGNVENIGALHYERFK